METAHAPHIAQLTVASVNTVGEIRKGDAVVAEDGVLGEVHRLVRSEARTLEYVIVRIGRALWRKYPVVPVSLVIGVESPRHLVRLRGRREAIRRFPETLPLVL